MVAVLTARTVAASSIVPRHGRRARRHDKWRCRIDAEASRYVPLFSCSPDRSTCRIG